MQILLYLHNAYVYEMLQESHFIIVVLNGRQYQPQNHQGYLKVLSKPVFLCEISLSLFIPSFASWRWNTKPFWL